jgi:hypothetical protein
MSLPGRRDTDNRVADGSVEGKRSDEIEMDVEVEIES